MPNTQEKLEADAMHHVLWSEIHGTPGYEATVCNFANVVRQFVMHVRLNVDPYVRMLSLLSFAISRACSLRALVICFMA